MINVTRSTVILLAAATVALIGPGCSKESRAKRHIAQADEQFAAGKYAEAEIDYKNALQQQPLNSQAIAQLGLLYFAEGRLNSAAPYLLKARELAPENVQVRLRLALTYLASGRLDDARREADFVLTNHPADAEAPALLADLARSKEAVVALRARLKQLPPDIVSKAPVIVALGLLDFREGNLKDAEAAFRQALVTDPKFAEAHAGLAMIYLNQKDATRGGQALAAAADNSPPRSARRLQYARFLVQSGDVAAAKQRLKQMTESAPDFVSSWLMLADIALTEGKFAESSGYVAQALLRDPANLEGQLFSARAHIAQGEFQKAVDELQRSLQMYPAASVLHYQLAVAYDALGQTDNAAASVAQSLKIAPGVSEAIILQAKLNLKKGTVGLAVSALRPLLNQRPDLIEAWLLLAEALDRQNNLVGALQTYDQVERYFPGNPRTQFLRATILLKQNKPADARQALTRALTISPDFRPALELLNDLDIREGQTANARQRAEQGIARAPDQPASYLLLAKIQFAEKDAAGAEATLRKALSVRPDSIEAATALAQLYLLTNQQDKALSGLVAVAEKNPKDTQAWMQIALLNEMRKDFPAARTAYEKVLAANPQSGAALNNLAYLYAERLGELDKANDAAEKARQLMPSEPRTADTLGWVLYKRKQYPRAVALLRDAGDALSTTAEVQYHLGLAYYMIGDDSGAKSQLTKALALNPTFDGAEQAKQSLAVIAVDPTAFTAAQRAQLTERAASPTGDPIATARLAAIYEREGAKEKAIQSYESLVQANSSNITASLALVRLYAAHDEVTKAFELAKAARKIAPNDPSVAQALGGLALQTGDYGWALSLLQEASRQLSDDPDLQYNLAHAAYGMGRIADAQGAAAQAAKSEGFSRSAEAKRLLDVIAVTQAAGKTADAKSVVDAALKTNGKDVAALTAKGAVQEAAGDLTEAEKSYADVLKSRPDFRPAQLRLAILYAAENKDDQTALDVATKAREAFPENAEASKALGLILYRRNTFDRSVTVLKDSISKADDAEARYYLGLAQVKVKDTRSAKENLQRALELKLKPELAAAAGKALSELK